MNSFLNKERPPVFCPGCSHETVVRSLDGALQLLELPQESVAIVTDIGCAGLLDTFFTTHTFHGLHGRALTYATGLKLARPDMTVIVIMGDGGLGIGGAHVLASCQRNLDLTLLILNNFNYGMTGGQCSATTPMAATTASSFLNQLQPPLDICQVAAAAGAPYTLRTMATDTELPIQLSEAIAYPGFALLDIWGLCPGRYQKFNRLTLSQMQQEMAKLPIADGPVFTNERQEFGRRYRRLAEMHKQPSPSPAQITRRHTPLFNGRKEILLLGDAGQHINTAGEILCLGAMTAGLFVTQKNDYPITVLRGHSISEVVLSREPIGYTGLTLPSVVICVGAQGIARRNDIFAALAEETVVIKEKGLSIPATNARVRDIDYRAHNLKPNDWALAALATLAEENMLLSSAMLHEALEHRFNAEMLREARKIIAAVEQQMRD